MKNDLLLNSDHQDKNMKRLGQNKMSHLFVLQQYWLN